MANEIIIKDRNKDLICRAPRCNCRAVKTLLTIDEADMGELQYTCSDGHINIFRFMITGKVVRDGALSKKGGPIRTKVSGVTFSNADGTSRQELLKRINAGDPLQIVSGKIEGRRAYLVKHAIGVIGMLKTDIVMDLHRQDPVHAIVGKVTQVTGGREEKATLGCNIELSFSKDTGWEGSPIVYMDTDGEKIYHSVSTCSGMKLSKEDTLAHARDVLHARPCKKCAENVGEK